MNVFLVGAVLVLLVGLAAPAMAGRIEGQLWLSRDDAKSLRTLVPTSTTVGRPVDIRRLLRAQQGVADAVVFVEAISETANRKIAKSGFWSWLPWSKGGAPRLKRMIQKDCRFVPRVMVIPAGMKIELQNLDRIYHNTFSVSAAKRFDLGKYPPGRIDTLAFEQSGVVNLHCDIHPDENGYVVVVPNRAYAAPDSLGRFSLPSLPAGSYRLRYWHPTHGEGRMRVDMPRRGNVTLELAY
jgi:plastocyanin